MYMYLNIKKRREIHFESNENNNNILNVYIDVLTIYSFCSLIFFT